MPIEKTDKIKHLEIVQEIIKRQAQNSFVIKGWSVTLVTVVLTVIRIQTQNTDPNLVLLAFAPVFIFWYLDALYLRQERLFRMLHNAIAKDIREETDSVLLFDMNLKPYRGQGVQRVIGAVSSAFSRTVLPVPLATAATILVIRLAIEP